MSPRRPDAFRPADVNDAIARNTRLAEHRLGHLLPGKRLDRVAPQFGYAHGHAGIRCADGVRGARASTDSACSDRPDERQ